MKPLPPARRAASGPRATASSEAADAVLMLDRLVDALAIARRFRAIALQSVLAGMGLSLAAMIVAACGYLPPLAGALFQEAEQATDTGFFLSLLSLSPCCPFSLR